MGTVHAPRLYRWGCVWLELLVSFFGLTQQQLSSDCIHRWCSNNNTNDDVLIRLAGDDYYIAARLWAFSSYYRFARPGATRVDASSNAEVCRTPPPDFP